MKPGTPALRSPRLLDQVRECIRYLHYSLSTEKLYVYWIRFFIRWHGREGQMQHPRDIGAPGIEAFLTMLAIERNVSASTHNQALSAILFLYRQVLDINLPWLNNINRPTQKRRIPSVLTKDEVAGVLANMGGPTALLARLLYGTGMRLMEGMRLRIKDVDFDRHVIVVRDAKGGKDRVVMLPRSLAHWLPRCAPRCSLRAVSGKPIDRCSVAAWRRPMRWRKSIPASVTVGHGFGCFRLPRFQLTRAVAWSDGITCTKTVYRGP